MYLSWYKSQSPLPQCQQIVKLWKHKDTSTDWLYLRAQFHQFVDYGNNYVSLEIFKTIDKAGLNFHSKHFKH